MNSWVCKKSTVLNSGERSSNFHVSKFDCIKHRQVGVCLMTILFLEAENISIGWQMFLRAYQLPQVGLGKRCCVLSYHSVGCTQSSQPKNTLQRDQRYPKAGPQVSVWPPWIEETKYCFQSLLKTGSPRAPMSSWAGRVADSLELWRTFIWYLKRDSFTFCMKRERGCVIKSWFRDFT